MLHVPDVAVLAGYLRDVLGFRWDFGDERYAVVWRDNSAAHFMEGTQEPAGVHRFQWVRNVDAYHAEIAPRGAHIAAPPVNRSLSQPRVASSSCSDRTSADPCR